MTGNERGRQSGGLSTSFPSAHSLAAVAVIDDAIARVVTFLEAVGLGEVDLACCVARDLEVDLVAARDRLRQAL